MGVILGITLPYVVSHFSNIETVVQWWTVVLAFGISVGIGIIFGLYPARRAAMMDPIDGYSSLKGIPLAWPSGNDGG